MIEQFIFKPVFVQVLGPKLAVVIKQKLKYFVVFANECHLKDEDSVFNECFLVVHLLSFVDCQILGSSETNTDFDLTLEEFNDIKVTLVDCEVKRVPHYSILDLHELSWVHVTYLTPNLFEALHVVDVFDHPGQTSDVHDTPFEAAGSQGLL